jgi:hypothetical protein
MTGGGLSGILLSHPYGTWGLRGKGDGGGEGGGVKEIKATVLDRDRNGAVWAFREWWERISIDWGTRTRKKTLRKKRRDRIHDHRISSKR